MRSGRGRSWLLPFLAASIINVACGDDPPDREIEQAQSAIDAARTAGAGDYARDEITAAEQRLSAAREAVGQRDYRLALTNALESRERAQAAAKEAADRKLEADRGLERALKDTSAALAHARGRLTTAEAARVPARVGPSSHRAIGDAERAVQEARAALDAGDDVTARKAIDAANTALAAATRDLDTRPKPAGPRRRK